MTRNNQLPFYVKLGFKFLIIFFVCFFIYVSQNILIPFAIACLLAVLLMPLVNFFEIKKFTKIPSIGISMILALSFIVGLVYFLSSQISNFMQDIPSIKVHLNEHYLSIQNWIREKFHVSFEQQNEYLNEQANKLKESGTGYISHTFFSITETVMLLLLMPIYTFLLLFYKDHIRNFLYTVFKPEHGERVKNVISKTKLMIRSYMVGLLIEMGIVAAGNSIGLILLGIKYAIFFGVMAAVFNLIPYIGMFTATLFTVLVTLTTTNDTSDIIWIVVIFYSIHIVDVNVLMPRIVASRLRINALISILGVVIGGTLTGISGLFLSIPAIAFFKIICDEVDDLKPWGMLMGDETTYAKQSDLYKKFQKISIKQSAKLRRNK